LIENEDFKVSEAFGISVSEIQSKSVKAAAKREPKVPEYTNLKAVHFSRRDS